MIHIKTYEGFFSKLKDKLKGTKMNPFTPSEQSKINREDFEQTLEDCFIDIIDAGFSVNIAVYGGPGYNTPHHSNYNISYSSGKRSVTKDLSTRMSSGSKKVNVLYQISIYKKSDKVVTNFLSGLRKPFNIDDIKETILFTVDTIKSMYDVNICKGGVSVEKDEFSSISSHYKLKEMFDEYDEVLGLTIYFDINSERFD